MTNRFWLSIGSAGALPAALLLVSSLGCHISGQSPAEPRSVRIGHNGHQMSSTAPLIGSVGINTTAQGHSGAWEVSWPTEGSASARASTFLRLASSLSDSNDARSVDYYYQAAALSWLAMAEQTPLVDPNINSWETYQRSLKGLIDDAVRYQRFDRGGHLNIFTPKGQIRVPTISTSLDWPVDQLQIVPFSVNRVNRKLKRSYQTRGLGVPGLIVRNKHTTHQTDPLEQYFPDQLPMAATIVLHPVETLPPNYSAEEKPQLSSQFTIELINPLRVNSVSINSRSTTIAKDLSVPLEYRLRNRPTNPITGFILPGTGTQDDGLLWVEPYQPGKIPVVFIHGLLSEPGTWLDMVNHLRTLRWFNDHYQIWGFSYATGSPFVTSAMRLRDQCREALEILDPRENDPALRKMVMVGHSMGGLLAKLQITNSEDRLWNSISRVPLASLQASAKSKMELEKQVFFSAQPYVKRVIYIATPHQGSSLAARGVGTLFSAMVQPDAQYQSLHNQVVMDNPGAFFGTFNKRIPTSIDLLQPNDRTLLAIYNLRVPYRVRQHAIVGTGQGPWTLGRSDGVVTVSSARHWRADSYREVPACHTTILHHDETTQEVIRILRIHLKESDHVLR
jgi:hypothetical protein